MDEDCNLVVVPPQFFPKEEGDTAPPIIDGATDYFRNAGNDCGAGHSMHSRNYQWDLPPWAIGARQLLTGHFTENWWSISHGKIRCWGMFGRSIWRKELTGAGPGWRLDDGSMSHLGGGVDSTWASFDIFGNFSYRGFFDPSGNIYFNTHHSVLRVGADGPADWGCDLSVHTRRAPAFWYWERECFPGEGVAPGDWPVELP